MVGLTSAQRSAQRVGNDDSRLDAPPDEVHVRKLGAVGRGSADPYHAHGAYRTACLAIELFPVSRI